MVAGLEDLTVDDGGRLWGLSESRTRKYMDWQTGLANQVPAHPEGRMWERWRQSWTLHQIAQLFDRAHTSVQGILSRTGGIRPPTRTRSATALTLAEREEISRA
jgi:hypothetical protein